MSLFTVIKYRNTNLYSNTELEALPEGLLMIYWNKVAVLITEIHDHSIRCAALSGWYEFQLIDGMEEKFLEALKEYESI